MARHLLTVSGSGSPTAAVFITKFNTAMSGLLNKAITAVQIIVSDALPASTRQILAVIEYEDGGVSMSAPYRVSVIESRNEVALEAQGETFFAANPTAFIAPCQFRYSDQLPNIENRYLSLYLTCADAAQGATNYQVSGAPSTGGTVTSVSVVTANGVSGSVATATTTPAITLVLGAITPTSVAASGTVTGSNLSGSNTGDQTITLTGDVTGTGTGSVAATIANSSVTFAKMANMNTARLLGRSTALAGVVEELTIGSGLLLSGGVLSSTDAGGTVTSVSVTTANGVSGSVATATTTPAITLTLGAITPTSVAASGTVTGSNLSGSNTGDQTITLTGDVTGTGTGSVAATIANSAVTLAKMANIATNTLLGRSTAAAGAVEVITVSTGLLLSGGLLTATGGGIPDAPSDGYVYSRRDGVWFGLTRTLENTVMGQSAFVNNTTGNADIAIGWEALRENTTGRFNTAVGSSALSKNTTGIDNTSIGANTLRECVSGTNNQAFGFNCAAALTTGSDNTCVGSNCLSTLTTGNNCSAFGNAANVDSANSEYRTAIGAGSSCLNNSTIRMGRASTDTLRGFNYTADSDRRLKENIIALPLGLDFIMKLRPVSYKWKDRTFAAVRDKEGTITTPSYSLSYHRNHAGFIAQEIGAALKDSGFDVGLYQDSGVSKGIVDELPVDMRNYKDPADLKGYSIEQMLAIAVKAIQELKAEITDLRKQGALN